MRIAPFGGDSPPGPDSTDTHGGTPPACAAPLTAGRGIFPLPVLVRRPPQRRDLFVNTLLHRLGAVLHLLDGLPTHADYVPADQVRRLLVGDLGSPTHVAVPVARLKWLDDVARTAEVAAIATNPEHQRAVVHSLRGQLDREPKDGA